MEFRSLEINLISADGLKNVNIFGKMDVYAVAFISGYPNTMKKTKVDKNCGVSPRWNEKLHFTVDERSLSNPAMTLIVQLKAEKPLGLDKDIGEVSVPLPELLKNGGGAERVVEYQVRTSSGKSKGVLKFSYKFGGKESYNSGQMNKADEPVTAYPPLGYKQGQAGTSTTTPVAPATAAVAYPPPNPGMGYHNQQPATGYGYPPPPPPQGYYGGYPQPGYGYPQPGYGYAPPAGYGYQQPPMLAAPAKKKKNGMGMGMGLGAGLLGGLLIGDMVSDVGDMAAYNDGYGDAMGDMGDMGGFDF